MSMLLVYEKIRMLKFGSCHGILLLVVLHVLPAKDEYSNTEHIPVYNIKNKSLGMILMII